MAKLALIWIKAQGVESSTNPKMPENDRDGGWVKRNALDLIEHEHHIQAQICDSLEQIADDLPDGADKRLCAQVASALREELPLHHRDEECGLFPLIERRALPGDGPRRHTQGDRGRQASFITLVGLAVLRYVCGAEFGLIISPCPAAG